ncbi:c-type cytochrome [Limnobacter sp.]|uniref:c-type cytochrome n=1 Tax=Limnobacter sp. TaxID=2003368 RepID=UPI002FE1BEFE
MKSIFVWSHVIVLAVLPCFAMAGGGLGSPKVFPPKSTIEAALIRGESVYKRYCVLCHGVDANGQGRAAKQYNPKPADLTQSPFPAVYKEMIIRQGGEALGRSKFMPPWEQELTDEQISDLVQYLGTLVKH